jgi:hypothetical protein
LFDEQQAHWGVDELNYSKRKALKFEIEKWQKKS